MLFRSSGLHALGQCDAEEPHGTMYCLGNGLAELQAHTTQCLVLLTQYGALVVELIIPLDQVLGIVGNAGWRITLGSFLHDGRIVEQLLDECRLIRRKC